MQYRTDWKQFLKYDEKGRRSHEFPVYLVDTAPNEKQYLYHDEYMALVAAEKAAKDARRAAREAELAASRPKRTSAGPSDPAEPAAVLAGRRACPQGWGDSLPPDIERHSRRCVVCSHPDRDAIEGEFIRWRSPHKIARDYNVTDRNSIYRHAHATNLFEARRRQIGRVLESYLETIDDTPPADFDPVTRAVRVYAHLNANGAWIEPRRTVHITHSQSPWPSPEFDPDPPFDPHPNDDAPHPEFNADPLDDPQTDLPAPRASGLPDHAADATAPNATIATRAERRSNIRPSGGGSFSSHINRGAERRTSVEQSPRSDRSDSFSGCPAPSAAARVVVTAGPVLRVEAPDFSRGEQRFSAAEENRSPHIDAASAAYRRRESQRRPFRGSPKGSPGFYGSPIAKPPPTNQRISLRERENLD